MKRLKKSTAIISIVLLAIVFIVGILACYVPITSGATTFLSFSGSTNISSDLIGGMYAEYEITTENPSKSDLIDSMQLIKEVFEEDGYKNVNVYVVGSKLRVEISYPWGSKSYSDAYSELSGIGVGAFYLCSSSSITDDDAIVINGSTCIDSIKVYTNNDSKYLSINFNSEGEALYEEMVDETTTVYLLLGDQSFTITVSSSVTDFSSLTLSDSDYSNLVALEQNLKFGCMKIEVNGDTAVISTMSAGLTAGESSSSPYVANSEDASEVLVDSAFKSSTAYVVSITALFVVIVLILVLFLIKFGAFAIVILLSMIFGSFLFVILLFLIPSIELGLSGIASLAIGISLIYSYAFSFACNVKNDYNNGKSLAASLENSYKKQLPNLLISNIFLIVATFILFTFSFGEITSAALIFVICVGLSLFINLLFIPLLIKIAISFNGVGRKLFMLQRRNSTQGSASGETISIDDADVVVSKEEE